MNLAGFRVWWQYGTRPVQVGATINVHPTTTCVVESENGGQVSATISLHHNDKLIKEKARVVSLSRAISEFPRELRSQIWEAYRLTKPAGRWIVRG